MLVTLNAVAIQSCGTHSHSVNIPVQQHTPPRFTLIILYDKNITGPETLLKAAKKYNAEVVYIYKNINGIAVSIPSSAKEDEAIRYFKHIQGILSVERDSKVELHDR